ncbi:MAG: GGDEF domain-containing protein [Treponema sp.]|nr:GGDEF domain-containing protein [Treponema sp.]
MSGSQSFRRISDVLFSLDENLNITYANRSFLQLLDITDGNRSLKDFIDAADADTLACFLKNFSQENNNHNCIINLRLGKKSVNCILYVKEKQNNICTISLQELHLSQENMERTILQNREYTAILGQFNSYLIVFNGKRYTLCNTKDMNDVYRGNKTDFMIYFADFFDINIEVDASKYQFDTLFNDIEQGIAEKNYRLLLTDNTQLLVRTMRSNARNSFAVIGLITQRNVTLTDNTYSEKRDGLTGLYNKITITDLAKKKVDMAKQPATFIIIDIDNFKEFNDNFGHAYGDKVLVSVAKVIEDSVGEQGLAGRIGGDEFLCVLDKTDETDIRDIARTIKMGVQWGIQAEAPDQLVTCSIGIARAPENASTYEDLFSLADKCLYIAKKRGRNCYIIYKPEVHNKMIVMQEESARSTASGKFYMEGALSEMGIIREIYNKNDADHIEKSLYMLAEYLTVHKVCIYIQRENEKEFKKAYILGVNDIDIRLAHLNNPDEDYFKYLNAYNFLYLDNVNNLDTMDKNRFYMYQENNIASTLEILCTCDDNKSKALVCFDIYKPSHTFQTHKIVFAIMAAKLISHELCSTIQA